MIEVECPKLTESGCCTNICYLQEVESCTEQGVVAERAV